MKTYSFPFALVAGTFLLATLAGCQASDFYQSSSRHSARPVATNPTVVTDDYDYYPRYEIYYSRHRNEYIGRETGWIRRIDLNGATYKMLRDGPSIPMDFHDSPALHHEEIVQRYPRTWEPEAAPRGQEQANEDRNVAKAGAKAGETIIAARRKSGD